MSRVRVCIVAATAVMVMAGTADAQRKYRVRIDSEPRGATIYVDSRDAGEVGTTPHEARLEAGSYKLILDKPGHVSKITTFEVKRQRRRQVVRIELDQASTGVLAVSAPKGDIAYGAAILVDGEEVGEVPDELDIEAGPHQVIIQPDDGEPYEEWIQIEAGQRLSIEPELGEAVAVDVTDDVEDIDEVPGEEPLGTPDPPASTGDLHRALLVLETGVDAAGRHFSFSGEQTSNLRPYDADGIPMFHLGIELYPLARFDNPSFRALGVIASFDYALSITSQFSDGTEVQTNWTQGEAGLRVRIPIGATLAAATMAFGAMSFDFDIEGTLAQEVPAADYQYLRYGVDLRHDTGKLGLFAGGGLLQISSIGGIAERFDAVEAAGYNANLGAAYKVGTHVEARLTARWQMFQQALSADPDDMFVADGSTDHLYGIMLGGAYVY